MAGMFKLILIQGTDLNRLVSRLTTCASLIHFLMGTYASRTALMVGEDLLGNALCFTRWQVVHGISDGRLCSVVFQADTSKPWISEGEAATEDAPGNGGRHGLTWLHVHETPLQMQSV